MNKVHRKMRTVTKETLTHTKWEKNRNHTSSPLVTSSLLLEKCVKLVKQRFSVISTFSNINFKSNVPWYNAVSVTSTVFRNSLVNVCKQMLDRLTKALRCVFQGCGLVLTIFNEGDYLTFESIFHKALNWF